MIKRFLSIRILFFIIVCALSLSPLNASFVEYLNEIETISKRIISQAQKEELIAFRNSNQIFALDKDDLDLKHGEFTQSKKNTLRKQWKENTEEKWLKYQKTVNCKVNQETICRQKGWYYDMHHIIPQTYNGPHVWWNVFPLTLYQHNDVHRDGTQCSLLFPNSTGIRKEDY
jgi:hypothetical protein